jgi:hydrogenase expression/formation protein HypC
MCLGIPGKVIEIEKDNELGFIRGKAQFGGIVKEVNLSYTPEVEIGDYVVVHVGFAISRIQEDEAKQVFQYLEELSELRELNLPEEGS